MSEPASATPRAPVVLRCRLAVRVADEDEGQAFEDALAKAITATVQNREATIELLQLAVAIDPSWAFAGPPNRC